MHSLYNFENIKMLLFGVGLLLVYFGFGPWLFQPVPCRCSGCGSFLLLARWWRAPSLNARRRQRVLERWLAHRGLSDSAQLNQTTQCPTEVEIESLICGVKRSEAGSEGGCRTAIPNSRTKASSRHLFTTNRPVGIKAPPKLATQRGQKRSNNRCLY